MRYFIFLIIFFPEGKDDDEVTSFFYMLCELGRVERVKWESWVESWVWETEKRDEDIPHTWQGWWWVKKKLNMRFTFITLLHYSLNTHLHFYASTWHHVITMMIFYNIISMFSLLGLLKKCIKRRKTNITGREQQMKWILLIFALLFLKRKERTSIHTLYLRWVFMYRYVRINI